DDFVRLTEAHDRLLAKRQLVVPRPEDAERASVVEEILRDLPKDLWAERLQYEERRTLLALRLRLRGEAGPRPGHPAALCDDYDGSKPRVAGQGPGWTIKGIMKSGNKYHVRMAVKNLVVESRCSPRLEDCLRWRTEIQARKCVDRKIDHSTAWLSFHNAQSPLWFTVEAGRGIRNTTPKTCDIKTATRFGTRLREKALKGKAAVLAERKRQMQELAGVRKAAAAAIVQGRLLQMVDEMLQPSRAKRRRL
ncbi:unnamed protein product, partial [Effrenium voratum]